MPMVLIGSSELTLRASAFFFHLHDLFGERAMLVTFALQVNIQLA
jgi:hypothetical protein